MPRCPICGEPAVARLRPFCSKRCADRDLGRWLKGVYVIRGEDGEAAEEAPRGGQAPPKEDET